MRDSRPRLQLAAVAEATGVPAQTIKRWLHDGYIFDQGKPEGADDSAVKRARPAGGGGRGRRRTFGPHSVTMLATVHDLLEVAPGADLAPMFLAAGQFALLGSGSAVAGMQRCPGMPFPPECGLTLVAVAGDRSGVFLDRGEPLAVMMGARKLTFFDTVRLALHAPGFVSIDAMVPFMRACHAFDVDPMQELAAAYPAGPMPYGGGFTFNESEPDEGQEVA